MQKSDHRAAFSIRRLASGLPFLVVLGALSLSACGGTPSASVASLGSTPTTSPSASAAGPSGASIGSSGGGTTSGGPHTSFAVAGVGVAFSRCMRSHGLSNFPDPNGQGVISGSGVNPGSARYQAAEQACSRYLPNGGRPPSPAEQRTALANALKFSKCMRAHGIPNFPDPTNLGGGQFGIAFHSNSGDADFSPGSGVFRAANKACAGVRTGPAGASGLPPAGSSG